MKNKPPLYKIFLSGLVDFLIFVLLAWAMNKAVFASPLANNYKKHYTTIIQIQDTYKLDSGFGEKTYLTPSNIATYQNYMTYTDANGDYVITDRSDADEEVRETYGALLSNDATYMASLDAYRIASVTLLAVVVGTVQLVLFVLIPLTNKNRATLGKMALQLKTVNAKTNEPIATHLLIGQFLILFIILSVLPYMVLGEFMLVFIPLLLFAFVLFDNELRSIHQRLAQVKTVEAILKTKEGGNNANEEVIV